MEEKTIKGIRYRLDEEILIATTIVHCADGDVEIG